MRLPAYPNRSGGACRPGYWSLILIVVAERHSKEHNALRRARRNAPGLRAPGSRAAAEDLLRSEQQSSGPPREKVRRGNPGAQFGNRQGWTGIPHRPETTPSVWMALRCRRCGYFHGRQPDPVLHCGAGEGLARNVRPGIEKYWHTVVPHEERVLSSIRHPIVQLGRIGLDAPAHGYRFFLRIQVPVNRLENLSFNDD